MESKVWINMDYIQERIRKLVLVLNILLIH